ncbi:hypothetical protein ACER0C_001311 [Sarotherodon galilaeus]
MSGCAGDAQELPSSFSFSYFLTSTLLSVYLSVSQSALSPLSLSLSGCLYKSPSVCVLCMRAQGVCVRQARGTNECLYSVEATGRRIGGQGLPSPPSNPTLPHSSVGRETPLLPPSARLHLFQGHPLSILPPTLSLPSQEKGWCKVSGKRRKRRRGSERAGAGGVPTGGKEREGGTRLAVLTCVSVQDVRTRTVAQCCRLAEENHMTRNSDMREERGEEKRVKSK